MSWDTKHNHAVITYTQDGGEGLHTLCDKDDTPLVFETELKAHQYLNELGGRDDQEL